MLVKHYVVSVIFCSRGWVQNMACLVRIARFEGFAIEICAWDKAS